MTTEVGTKYDDEKPDFSLIDAEWLEEVAKVMTAGKAKYSAHNWRKGLSISRLLAAALRHLFAVVRGEDNDPETGLSHLAHLSCCAMFAYFHLKHRPDLDDRWKLSDHPLKYRTDLDDRYKNPKENISDRQLTQPSNTITWSTNPGFRI